MFHFCNLLVWIILISCVPKGYSSPWKMHIIDNSSQGADGVRVGDANNDGLLDFATGWEEGGKVRICINPGHKRSKFRWPSTTVGKVKSPEDAFWADINGDGVPEVVSCCEGGERTSYVHYFISSNSQKDLLKGSLWKTEVIGPTENTESWMFGASADIDRDSKTDLVLSSKGHKASVSLLRRRSEIKGLSGFGKEWNLTRLSDAGWVMSLRLIDIDKDKDLDILFTDRKGPLRGVRWLENPCVGNNEEWVNHFVGGRKKEVMFLDVGDLDSDGMLDILCATRNGHMILFHGDESVGFISENEIFQMNPEGILNGKAVKIADIDGDGDMDIAHTANTGSVGQANGRAGVHWLENNGAGESDWKVHPISGIKGIKFDRIELIDLDGDDDLDLITCEERDNLGLVWFENPHRNP